MPCIGKFYRPMIFNARALRKDVPLLLDQIMNAPIMNYAPRGLAAATLRHEVLSNNIANINTPHFKKTDVVFEELLAKEIYGDEDSEAKIPIVRTHDRHLPFATRHYHATPMFERHEERTMRVDDNNVDIDIEMATMAKNQLYYNALATRLGTFVSGLKTVITSNQS